MSTIDISSIMADIEEIDSADDLYDDGIAKRVIMIDVMADYLTVVSAWKAKAKKLKEPVRNIDALIKDVKKENPFLDASNSNSLESAYLPDSFKTEKVYQTGKYKVSSSGVYYLKADDSKVGVTTSMIVITSVIIGDSTTEGFVELYYSSPTNNSDNPYKYQQAWVPASWLSSTAKITRLYDFYGIDVTSANAKMVITYLSDIRGRNCTLIKQLKGIDHLGKYRGMLLPWESDKVVYVGDSKIADNLKPSGDYKEWLKIVSKYSSIDAVKIAIGTALGSLIASDVGCQPFVCHLWGDSSSGKTIASMIAASFFGNPSLQDNGLLQSANGTFNALMHHASTMHDLPCFFDETETIKKKENLDQLIMQLCEGRNRSRLKSGSESEKPKSWRCLFVTTGEAPICKENSFAGVGNRIIEVNLGGVTDLSTNGPQIARGLGENNGHFVKLFWDKVKAIKDLAERNDANRELLVDEGRTLKQANIGAIILTAYQIAREVEPELAELTADNVASNLKAEIDINQNLKAYNYLLDTISTNQNKFFHRENSGGYNFEPNGEIWGKMNNGTITIIKTVFDKVLNDAGYDPKGTLKWLVHNSCVDKKANGRIAVTERLGQARANCLTLLVKSDKNEVKNLPFLQKVEGFK